MKNNRLVIILCVVAFLLLIPLISMQFDIGVNWTAQDFVAAGILLGGVGLMGELVMRKVKTTRLRVVMCAGLLVTLLLLWAELAVGIFGSPIAGS
jgi:hypothetical protein